MSPISPFTPKAARDMLVRAGWRTLAESDMKIQELNGAQIKEQT